MNRVSIGVQDFDPKIQQAIGREQSFEVTEAYNAKCRTRGVARKNVAREKCRTRGVAREKCRIDAMSHTQVTYRHISIQVYNTRY